MKSRLIAGAAALVVAVLGIILVFTYVSNADARAAADLEPVQVMVVQQNVPAGTDVEVLRDSLKMESLPASTVADTALKDLNSSEGKVTAVNLIAGEQLLAERLVDPNEARDAGSAPVPKGLQEVSFLVEPQRAVGGRITPGDRAGIFISLETGGVPGEKEEPSTQLVIRKALVTSVQRAPQPESEDPEQDAQALPEGSQLITVAVNDEEAARIVFAAEFGRIWVSSENDESQESDPTIMDKSEVYR